MGQYSEGTVSVSSGSSVVTGTNTLWLTEAISAGDLFRIQGVPGTYEVASVVSDTELNLTATWADAGMTDVLYLIHRDFTSPDNFPIPAEGDIEYTAILSKAITRIQDTIETLRNTP